MPEGYNPEAHYNTNPEAHYNKRSEEWYDKNYDAEGNYIGPVAEHSGHPTMSREQMEEWERQMAQTEPRGPTGAYIDHDPEEFYRGLEAIVAGNQRKAIMDYLEEYSLEIGGLLVAGSLAFYARQNPEIAKGLIVAVTESLGDILDVPGELTSVMG